MLMLAAFRPLAFIAPGCFRPLPVSQIALALQISQLSSVYSDRSAAASDLESFLQSADRNAAGVRF